jgi:glyoxylate/hydroxypyruvate reductase
MMRIFTTLDLTPSQIARLQQALGQDTLFQSRDFTDQSAERAAFEACEIVFGNPPAAWVGASAALRWIQLESVGFNAYLLLDWSKLIPRLQVTNLAGFFDEPAAESILAGVLALYRRIDLFVNERPRAHWAGDAARPGMRTLKGAKVLLLGFGAINKRVAELLAPFACQLTTIRRGETGALDAALPVADLVIATVPDTPATRNLLDRKRLAALKAGAIVVNFGRGTLLDENALADELETGRLAGAVVDVTREEPLPAEHRFWRAPNLILTQHTGGGNHDEIDRKITRFIENLSLYRRGEALIGVIDHVRGY